MIADDPSVIQPILAQLKKSFMSKRTLPLEYRRQQLLNLKRGVKELEPKIQIAQKKDIGMTPIMTKMLTTNLLLDEIKNCLKNLNHWTKLEKIDVPLLLGPGTSYTKPEPLGVALVISAWNYPLTTSIPYVISAIAAGNCCVIKPSELAPNASNIIAELFDKYLDKDCYRCIEGKVEVAKAIIKEPFDIIVFTGSTDKGKLVAKAAAENLTPYILELGGKSPTIVDRNADLDNAALRIMQGRFMNAGQVCVACDYLFVHKDVKNELIKKFKETLLNFYGENPSQSKDYERIINEFHVKRLKSYLDEDHGGKVILGGEVDEKEKYIAPTLIEKPKLTSKLMQEEIFGPILPIYEFDDFDFVVNFINERPKPLSLYYYGSGSSPNYRKLKNETFSGALSLNESIFHVGILDAPFGGVGFSGQGKLHGHSGFKAFSHYKTIFEKGGLNIYPFNVRYPPYEGFRLKSLDFMLGYSRVTQNSIMKIIMALFVLFIFAILFKTNIFMNTTKGLGNFVSEMMNTKVKGDL